MSNILRGPELKYPIDEATLGEFLFNNAKKYKDNICHIDGTTHETETYGSVNLRSTRVAIAMQKRGVTSNDVIAFCCPNTLDNTIPMIASFYLGSTVCNLEGSLSVRHTKHLLGLVNPKMIFVEEAAVNLIEDSLVGADFQPEIVVFGASNKYLCFSELIQPQEGEERFRPAQVNSDNATVLLFSSGTTGLAKAISLSHTSVLHLPPQHYQLGLEGTVYHLSTFYWITAYLMLTTSFMSGSSRVFSRNPSTEDIFKIIETYKVTCLFLAPVLTYKLTDFEERNNYNTSSLRIILCGGTPMAPSQKQKLNQHFPSAIAALAYGMSEIGTISCFDFKADEDLVRKKLSMCGKPAPGVLLKIVDPDTEEALGPNKNGEIRLKAPSVMKGYYNGDASQAFDKNGFFKTGDVGFYDDDGCICVVERLKEMFKYQSWHIIPSAVEAVLLELPAVKEVCVFGLPHAEDGDVPAACVVLKDGFSLSEEEIDVFLKKSVADRERLRGGVTFVDVLPRTPTGKLLRKEVRDFVIKSKGC